MSGDALAGVLDRARDPEAFARWEAQVRAARWCTRPVRLAGRTELVDAATGELAVRFTSDGQPDGVVLKACGCRRESVCSTCAAMYRADAFQLVAAGLRGGKGVPESVAAHPAVFVTLTAPGFGPVHARRMKGRRVLACRGRRDGDVCPHGTTLVCTERHEDDDERLGEPLCAECFDYEAAVLWNAAVTELWRRTTIYVRRSLARDVGITAAELDRRARMSYAKVVEYQRRGIVHVHAVVRLDARDGAPPDSRLSLTVLATAIVQAASSVSAPLSFERDGAAMVARWGRQLDVRPIAAAPAGVAVGAVAAYVAKYATKSTDAFGQLDHRLNADDIARLSVRPHLRTLVETVWRLGGRPELADLGLRQWAHTLGFRGHWLTKSRRYSTTFTALRRARSEWHDEQRDEFVPTGIEMKSWRFAGRGYTTPGDAWLVASARPESREAG